MRVTRCAWCSKLVVRMVDARGKYVPMRRVLVYAAGPTQFGRTAPTAEKVGYFFISHLLDCPQATRPRTEEGTRG